MDFHGPCFLYETDRFHFGCSTCSHWAAGGRRARKISTMWPGLLKMRQNSALGGIPLSTAHSMFRVRPGQCTAWASGFSFSLTKRQTPYAFARERPCNARGVGLRVRKVSSFVENAGRNWRVPAQYVALAIHPISNSAVNAAEELVGRLKMSIYTGDGPLTGRTLVGPAFIV